MPLHLDLENRTALVTGASRGIGAAIARTLAEAGANLVLASSRSVDDLDPTREWVEASGGHAATVAGNLRDPATAARYVGAARDAFGGLDILVNNAGIWEGSAIAELDPSDLERMLETNLASVFHLCREAVPLLTASTAGRIVNISSTASLLGEPEHAAYAATKGGLDALTRSLAVELGPRGITVNSVAPGWTRTDMTAATLDAEEGRAVVASIPLRKAALPEDVAYAVGFFASDWSGHVSGVTLAVDGAYRLRR